MTHFTKIIIYELIQVFVLQVAKLAEDSAFPDKLIQNEEALIQLNITPTTHCESESIVLSVSGDKTNNLKVNDKDPQGPNTFPVSPESYSSSEEELKEIQRASESLFEETAAELAHIKETVWTKQHSDSGDEELIQIQIKQTSENKDLSPTHQQSCIAKQIREKDNQVLHEDSDADTGSTDHEAERVIKQLNVPEESVDSRLLSQEQEGHLMQASPIDKTVKTFHPNDNENEETRDLNNTRAISVQQNAPVSQTSEEESLAEDMSKDGGSSSMQASHITSGTTSPTSMSSLGEESDSSPCHKKENLEGKQQRKVKHRPGQTLQTIADSSEEEEILGEGDQLIEQEIQRDTDQRQLKMSYKKSSKEKDNLLDHPSNHSQIECIPKIDEVLQVSEIKIYETFSYSNISPSTESEQENVVSHQLPPVDVMRNVGEKQLKSADEAYEEIMQKAQELKAMTKKITPPAIEPLYEGMLIEDYAYESLVEEPAQAIGGDHNTTVDEYLTNVSVQQTERKLQTPEEAYEERQKNRELMLKDQTFEHAQLNKSAHRDTTVTAITDTCYVNISENYEFTKPQDENWQWYAETANDELLEREKEVMTPGTSPTQSTPLSPVSPLSLSEPLYDSSEVVQIPSSGEEDNDKDEFATEPIECAMEPYMAESIPSQDQPVKNVLYPIPDLKITQCSSGEEEAEDEESITQEYEIVMLNGIVKCDDRSEEASEFIESSLEAQSIESEPTSVVSEVPLSKSALEHVSLASAWDSQASPQSLPSKSLDLTTSSSCVIDQTAGQASIPPKPYVAESPTSLGSDSAQGIISVADLVSKPACQDFVRPHSTVIDISVEEIVCPSQVAASTQQTVKISTAPSLPGMSATKPPLVPKPTLVSSQADTAVSESSVTPEPNQATKPADVSISKPLLAPKPVFTSKPTPDAIIVTIQDGVSQPDSVLQTTYSKTILEPTNIVDYSTLMSTTTVTPVSTHEQITASVTSQAVSSSSVVATVSLIPDYPTAPVYVSQAQIPCITSTPFVPDVVFPTSEHPIQVPALDPTPRYTRREHASSAIIPEPVPIVVKIPDLVSSSPSEYPIHSAGVISTQAHTPALPSTSTIDQGHISTPTAVSTYSSKDTLATGQSVSFKPCVLSSSVEQGYICSTVSEPTKPSAPVNSFIQHQHVSPTVPGADMTAMTPAIKIPISCIDADKSFLEQTAAHELSVAVSQTFQSVDHTAPKVFPTINTTVAFVTLSFQPTQSIGVDTKPKTGNFQPAVEGSHTVTPALQTGQDTAIIVPNVESIPMIKQETQAIITNTLATSIQQVRSPPVVSVSPVISSDASPLVGLKASLPSDLTFVSIQLEPQVAPISRERADKPFIEFPPPPAVSPPALPPDSLPNTPFNQQSVVPTTIESVKSIVSQAPTASVNQVATSIHKSPPPVPPKPFCVPGSLAFSHKSRESVKPSVIHESTVAQIGHAATLPRTREPPKALPLSLTAPTDIKHSISSPKSPLSPRFAKTLETYVVITLPSEPGSPVEGVTTQAPICRPSLPTPKQQGLAIESTMFTPPVVCAPLIMVSQPGIAPLPKVISGPTFTAPIISGQTGDSASDVTNKSSTDDTVASASSAVSVPYSIAPSHGFVPQTETDVLPTKMYEENTVYSAPHVTTTMYPAPELVSKPTVTSTVLGEISDMTTEPKINFVSTGISAPPSSIVSVPYSVATNLDFVPQIETVIQPIKRETHEEKATYSVPPVAATVCLAPTEVSIPIVTSPFVDEIPDMTIEPKINTVSTVISAPASNAFSVPYSVAPSPAFVPQIQTAVPIKNKMYDEKPIYSASPMNTTVHPATTVVSVASPETLLAVSGVTEIPAMTIEPNNISAVISATEMCATHISAPQSQSLVPASLQIKEIPVELTPTSFTIGITPTSSREPSASPDVMQGLERQMIQTVYPAPVTVTKLPLSSDNLAKQMLELEEEAKSTKGPSSDQIQQHQICIESQQMVPSVSASIYTAHTTAVPFAQFKKSVESQELRGTDKVLSSMSQLYSTIATTEQHQYALPNLLAQVVTTEVQRTTTVSVVQERIALEPISDPTSRQATPKQSGKTHCIDDVIDLTTLKVSLSMTDKGMDLTAPDSNLQSFLNDSSCRQITAVQPKIVNLSAEITPATTLSVATNSMTVVTCTATFTYNNNITVDATPNLQSVTSMPLPLKTHKPFEPLAQIVYRPVNSQPKPICNTEIPINLSRGPAEITALSSLPVKMSPIIYTPSSVPIHIEASAGGAMDLTISKPKRTMLALTASTGVVTSVVEDVAPVDLTSGRQTVCCDVLYRLPFTGSCRTQPPMTTTDKQFVARNYDQHNATTQAHEDLSNIKTLRFGGNFTQNGFVSQNDARDGAIDLTSAKMSRGQYYSACVFW